MRSSWSASCARVRLDHPDKDVTWLSPAGEEMATEQWEDGNARCFGMLLDGRAQESGVKRRGSDATLMTMVNFTLPSVPEGRHWQGLIDTNRPDSLAPLPSIGEPPRGLCREVRETKTARRSGPLLSAISVIRHHRAAAPCGSHQHHTVCSRDRTTMSTDLFPGGTAVAQVDCRLIQYRVEPGTLRIGHSR